MCVHICVCIYTGFPGGINGKEPSCQYRRCKRHRFGLWVRKIPWRRAWQPTLVFLLENPMDRGALQAIVHGVTKSDILLKQLSMCRYVHMHMLIYI